MPAKRKKQVLWQGVVTSLVAVGVFFGLLEAVLALVGVKPVLRSEDPFVGFASKVPLFVEETDPDGRKFLATPENKGCASCCPSPTLAGAGRSSTPVASAMPATAWPI